MTTITKDSAEAALDQGLLWALMANGRYWKLRRNGKTKTWKTKPDRFNIPVKAGLKSFAIITETSRINLRGSVGWRMADFVVAADGSPLATSEYDAPTSRWRLKLWRGHWQEIQSETAPLETHFSAGGHTICSA